MKCQKCNKNLSERIIRVDSVNLLRETEVNLTTGEYGQHEDYSEDYQFEFYKCPKCGRTLTKNEVKL